MSPRLRLHFAVQTLAVMVGVAGACVAVLVDGLRTQDLCTVGEPAPMHAADPSPPSPCPRGAASIAAMAPAERQALARSQRRALVRCQAQLGADAPACDPEAVMPLELAVCLVEGEIGAGQVQRVALQFDDARGRMLWLIGDRHRAYRITR